jgi:hypothetical protein
MLCWTGSGETSVTREVAERQEYGLWWREFPWPMMREEIHDTAGVSDTPPSWIRTGRGFVCNASDPPPDLIEGFLPGGGLVMLTGAPGRIGGIEAMLRVSAGAEVPRRAADGGRASSEPSGWRSRAAP